ncbi:hypothetical protein D3C79_736960 [compost metagenome]
MGCDHHHPALAQVSARCNPQLRLTHQSTVAPTQAQAPSRKRFGKPGKVQVTKAVYAPLESLNVFTSQAYRRIEETPQPATLQAHLQD